MNKKQKFKIFLESLKGNGQDKLIESVKQGFQTCFEGFMSVIGQCGSCKNTFSFNADFVPSIRDQAGVKQPICKQCIDAANPIRKERGLPEFEVHPQAYEPQDEGY